MYLLRYGANQWFPFLLSNCLSIFVPRVLSPLSLFFQTSQLSLAQSFHEISPWFAGSVSIFPSVSLVTNQTQYTLSHQMASEAGNGNWDTGFVQLVNSCSLTCTKRGNHPCPNYLLLYRLLFVHQTKLQHTTKK